MEQDVISIIIPVYNVEKYLTKCIESVLNQTYRNLEILLIDDGSTDSSGEICDAYANKDRRIRVIHKKNGGLSDARNVGMDIAVGAYIGFVDSDDWIEPDMYERLYKLAAENFLEVVAGRFCETVEGIDKEECFTNEFRIMTGEEMLRINILGHPQCVITNSVWDRLYRRELIAGMRFPVGRKYEDILFSTEVFLRAKKCGYLDSKVYHYTIREASIMGQGLKSKDTFNEDILKDLLPQIKDKAKMLYEAGHAQLGDECMYGYYRECLTLIGRFWGIAGCRKKVKQLMQEYKLNRSFMRKHRTQRQKGKFDRTVWLANRSMMLYCLAKGIERITKR